jgi:hypothetical protein
LHTEQVFNSNRAFGHIWHKAASAPKSSRPEHYTCRTAQGAQEALGEFQGPVYPNSSALASSLHIAHQLHSFGCCFMFSISRNRSATLTPMMRMASYVALSTRIYFPNPLALHALTAPIAVVPVRRSDVMAAFNAGGGALAWIVHGMVGTPLAFRQSYTFCNVRRLG